MTTTTARLLWLTKPLPNPQPDRRYTRNWTLHKKFPSGLYLLRESMTLPNHPIKELVKVNDDGDRSMYYLSETQRDDPRYTVLLAALEAIEPNWRNLRHYIALGDYGDWEIRNALRILLRNGDVTREQLDAALAIAEAELDDSE
jgi:hypothetical protein